MMIPTVHLNGDTADRLVEQNRNVADAARALLEALAEASPNARNFYVQGPNAFSQAASEHTARCEAVRAVMADAATIALAVQEQADERRRKA